MKRLRYIICQNPECDKPIPPGRRKYCSDKCGDLVNKTDYNERHKRPSAGYRKRHLTGKDAGARICLSCERTFLSEGPWNRICPRCSEGTKTLTRTQTLHKDPRLEEGIERFPD